MDHCQDVAGDICHSSHGEGLVGKEVVRKQYERQADALGLEKQSLTGNIGRDRRSLPSLAISIWAG